MAATIKAIDNDSAQRIHSGQVVLELQTAIKELVENSLDAGSTSIDVRIKDNGLDTVEVSDNGSGIAESDWPFIAMKHHTSKLPALSDLPHVTTFGFRGEALAALCALSESVTVTTATKETAPMGAVIKLDKDGSLLDSSVRTARPRGTTVTISGLFKPLPVRRKEFERTVKREFTKALTLLTAYALVPASVSTDDGRGGVRLKVESLSGGKGGKRSTLLSTDGKGSLRTSVVSVWGPKALDGILNVDLELEVEIDKVMARREGLEEGVQTVKVSGLISAAEWGRGRSSADRQFFYINGRPADLPKISRTVHEVYKSVNTHQFPLVILDFRIPRESVDINVSPDKRTIYLHSEAQLLDSLRTALETFFQPSRSSYAVEGASQTVSIIKKNSTIQTTLPITKELEELDDSGDAEDDIQTIPNAAQESGEEDADVEVDDEEEREDEIASIDSPAKSRARNRAARISTLYRDPVSSPSQMTPSQAPTRKVQQTLNTNVASWSPEKKESSSRSSRDARAKLRDKLTAYASQGPMLRDDEELEEEEPTTKEDAISEDGVQEVSVTDHHAGLKFGTMELDLQGGIQEQEEVDQEAAGSRRENEPLFLDEDEDFDELDDSPTPVKDDSEVTEPQMAVSDAEKESMEETIETSGESLSNGQSLPGPSKSSRSLRNASSNFRDEIVSNVVQGEVTLKFDMDRLQKRYTVKRWSKPPSRPSRNAFSAVAEGSVDAAAGIGNRDSALAEEALSRVISKSDFERMEVLGQFNKGFIIARLRSPSSGSSGSKTESDDLFIIDQHASDEKFNFETLQRTTVIKAQSLIRPRPLQLTAGDEITAMENTETLKANGFEVKIDEDKPPGRGERVSLAAMPVSKETTFDLRDLEQLLHMLSDGARPTGQMVRCTKARAMFAMRACRKSVMIGKSLTKAQMVQLLRNMGTIDQPWNCPHGRPTMRHLTKIDKGSKSRSGAGRINWKKWTPTS